MQHQGPQTWKKWASVGIILWAVGLQARFFHMSFNIQFFALILSEIQPLASEQYISIFCRSI
jgi:hypothetical protein